MSRLPTGPYILPGLDEFTVTVIDHTKKKEDIWFDDWYKRVLGYKRFDRNHFKYNRSECKMYIYLPLTEPDNYNVKAGSGDGDVDDFEVVWVNTTKP